MNWRATGKQFGGLSPNFLSGVYHIVPEIRVATLVIPRLTRAIFPHKSHFWVESETYNDLLFCQINLLYTSPIFIKFKTGSRRVKTSVNSLLDASTVEKFSRYFQ